MDDNLEKIKLKNQRDKITIKGMKFYGFHGVLPEEREVGQLFYIDLEMYLDLEEAGDSDDVKDTINYAEVFDIVKNISKDNKFRLIEKLAQTIACTLLQKYNLLEKIKVRVKKPEAPIQGVFDWVGVELNREKAEGEKP